MNSILSGAYRKITAEEAEGRSDVEWAEGIGWVAYDAQAQREFQAALTSRVQGTRDSEE